MMKSKYENLKIKYSRSKLGWYWAPLFGVSWIVLFYLVVLSSFYYIPNMLKKQDESSHPGHFIGERAEHTLLQLTKIGPRVTGSPANEQGALYILLNEIGNIKEESRQDLYNIDSEVQVASGNYATSHRVYVYQSIQNVVVKVTPKHSNSTVSLLVNSHFDTETGSPGAGDSGFMIAIMMETLRVITKYETPIEHSIIFLFNGAEEASLLGSHAFITQHRWAKNVRAFINLDAMGSGGREMLFRYGPGAWLIKYYGDNVVHPFATILGKELFELGMVGSNTDYRIFEKQTNLPGLDLASVYNGYVYHSKYDRFNVVSRGSYQSTGDNILALTKALASAPELNDTMIQSHHEAVFFDVVGWFFVRYSTRVGLILNNVVCVLAIFTILVYIWNMAYQTGMFRRRIFAKFGILFAIQFAAVVLAILVTISVAYLMDAVGLPLSWYSQKWMISGLYFCPMFFVLGIVPAIYLGKVKEHGLPLGYSIQLLMHSHCLILCALNIICTGLGFLSTFLITISVGFYMVSVILNIATCFHNKIFLWLIPHILCQILPFVFFAYNCYMFYEVIVPVSGRSGVSKNPEVPIAVFSTIGSLLLVGFLVPIFCLFKKSKFIISCFAIICVVFIILAATPIGFPYTEKVTSQRFVVQHTTRTFHNPDPQMSVNRTDSGFYITLMDRRTKTFEFLANETEIDESSMCTLEVVRCGYPSFSSSPSHQQTVWIPGPQPQLDGWPTIEITSKDRTSARTVLYTLKISGPDHMAVYIDPLNGTRLVDWTFNRKAIYGGRWIKFVYGLDPTPFRFYLEFEYANSNWSGPAFDMMVISDKLHHDIFYTDGFREFLGKFPSWTDVTPWLSSYETWRL